MRRSLTKKEAQRRHAKRRLRERYGWWLSDEDFEIMIAMIRRGEGERIERKSNRVSLYWLSYEGARLRVVYDHKRHEIASVLPKEPKEISHRAATTGGEIPSVL